jgi:hypothetical protein
MPLTLAVYYNNEKEQKWLYLLRPLEIWQQYAGCAVSSSVGGKRLTGLGTENCMPLAPRHIDRTVYYSDNTPAQRRYGARGLYSFTPR